MRNTDRKDLDVMGDGEDFRTNARLARGERRREFYDDMLNDAEAYVSYWWAEAREAGEVKAWDAVTIRDVRKGWHMLVQLEHDGKFHHCGSDRSVRDAERSLMCGDGGEDYDDCVADAVIQLALLGQIIYG